MRSSFEIDDFKNELSERFGIPSQQLEDESSLIHDFGIDSLALFNTMTALEEQIGVKLEITEIIECNTIARIYNYLMRAMNQSRN